MDIQTALIVKSSAAKSLAAMVAGGIGNAALWDKTMYQSDQGLDSIPFTGEWDNSRLGVTAKNVLLGMAGGGLTRGAITGKSIPMLGGAITSFGAAPFTDAAIKGIGGLDTFKDVERNQRTNQVLLALLGAGGLGLGVKHLLNKKKEMTAPADRGLVRVTLPRTDSSQDETTVEIPMEHLALSNAMNQQLGRDIRRRLRSGANQRTFRRTEKGLIEPEYAEEDDMVLKGARMAMLKEATAQVRSSGGTQLRSPVNFAASGRQGLPGSIAVGQTLPNDSKKSIEDMEPPAFEGPPNIKNPGYREHLGQQAMASLPEPEEQPEPKPLPEIKPREETAMERLPAEMAANLLKRIQGMGSKNATYLSLSLFTPQLTKYAEAGRKPYTDAELAGYGPSTFVGDTMGGINHSLGKAQRSVGGAAQGVNDFLADGVSRVGDSFRDVGDSLADVPRRVKRFGSETWDAAKQTGDLSAIAESDPHFYQDSLGWGAAPIDWATSAVRPLFNNVNEGVEHLGDASVKWDRGRYLGAAGDVAQAGWEGAKGSFNALMTFNPLMWGSNAVMDQLGDRPLPAEDRANRTAQKQLSEYTARGPRVKVPNSYHPSSGSNSSAFDTAYSATGSGLGLLSNALKMPSLNPTPTTTP